LVPILGRPLEPFGPELAAPDEGQAPELLPDIVQSERGRGFMTREVAPPPLGAVVRSGAPFCCD
jgi:hypothetical protein